MTSIVYAPAPFLDDTGAPLSGGKVYTYLNGTTTPQTTYSDLAGTTPNTNPIILDTGGRCSIFGNGFFTLKVYKSDGVTLVRTIDGVGSAATSSALAALSIKDTLSLWTLNSLSAYGTNSPRADVSAILVANWKTALLFKLNTSDSDSAPVEVSRFDSAGNFLIGTNTATYNAAGRGLVEVNGTSEARYALKQAGVGVGYLGYSGTTLTLTNESSGALVLKTNALTRFQIDSAGTITDGTNELGYKGLPVSAVTSGAFGATDKGKIIRATAGVTVPNATMAATDVVTIYNTTASPITITATVSTMRYGGTALTGNRTLAGYGLASIYFDSPTLAIITGSGLS